MEAARLADETCEDENRGRTHQVPSEICLLHKTRNKPLGQDTIRFLSSRKVAVALHRLQLVAALSARVAEQGGRERHSETPSYFSQLP